MQEVRDIWKTSIHIITYNKVSLQLQLFSWRGVGVSGCR